ncbi:transposase, IS605 OrfB family protein [Halosimplex carlsbadense 2-9-1]|uniref:Transposase, IS605 OrfB family protein n=1 Tax=Halosimplex carlsbadense 2-9-1 TaxID=797114 RepID=M0CFR8_9EURY|nr:zinc ribbon domain-containing protein [Halosimplex carlsbadense]ELZ21483.1 transposase, IS605 OrfB family protein [Halosimplex carlsbadense 2-9-1]
MSGADQAGQETAAALDPAHESPTPPRRHGTGYTAVGVDLGEWYLAVAAPAGREPDEALVVSGEEVREQYAALVGATHALEEATFDTTRGQSQLVAAVWESMQAEISDGVEQVVEYARQFPTPLLVLEDLYYSEVALWEQRTSRELGAWLLPAFREALVVRANEVGLPVANVDPKGSTQQCHVCSEAGEVREKTLLCTTPDCPVEEVCRDRSAALTIAQRAIGE